MRAIRGLHLHGASVSLSCRMPVPSLVSAIPAYNEGDRLHGFLQDWAAVASRHATIRVTGVVVDDGSRDEDAARHQHAVDAANRVLTDGGAGHQLRYLRAARNQGKGASIRWSWREAGGDADWLGFVDADGAIPSREFWRLASALPESDADAICGSRIKMAGRTIERSLFRHLQGRAFATAVDELFHFGMYDTQCGLKFFRAATVRPMLPKLQESRWLLDVELLAQLQRAGARCLEMPVDCFQRGSSSLVFGVDSVRMLVRLVRLRRRLRAADPA
jgi:dolichyl-phosphate beta-glucosyltransferase